MGELHTGPKHPLVAQTLSLNSTFTWCPLDTNQKERATVGTWRNMTRLTLGGRGSLALAG